MIFNQENQERNKFNYTKRVNEKKEAYILQRKIEKN